MFKQMKAAALMVMAYLKITEMPLVDGKVAFSDDQTTKLQEDLSEEVLTQLIDAFNKEIEANGEVKSINKEITEILAKMDKPAEVGANAEKEKVLDADANAKVEEPKSIDENMKALKAKLAEKDQLIQALITSPEEDSPLAIIRGAKGKEMITHSKTHLYGEAKEYNAFAGRRWNQRAAGLTTEATDWTEATEISKLNGDMTLFFRENPDEIKSLHRDNFGLPAHWKKRMNVVDRIVSGSIATAEISQGRKLPWLAKNKQTIQPEEGYIFPISIDIEFIGHLLSDIEASWISQYNKEGSQAYKMTFVRFLVSEIDKRARLEDRIATVKGVYVKTPDNATKPGKFINRQNGLLYQFWKARDVDKKYRAFNLGTPTAANIVDYIDNLIKSLPLEVRNSIGLELELSPAWLTAYKRRYETLYALNTDYDGVPAHPKDFPNIKFVKVVDYEGTDFMSITYSDNVEILENLPKEKSLYKFEMLKRIIYVFADYKLGIRLIHIGNKVKAGDPDEFKVQTVWSNDVPIFTDDFFVPVFDDTTGEITATFNQIKIDDAWATDITKIDGLASGQIVRVQGDTSLAASKNVVSNTDLVLASNFDLQSGGTLTMFVMPDGKLKELSRTTEPEQAADDVVLFDEDPIDASIGSEFNYDGDDALAITEILNGVPAQQIKITGKAGAGTNVTLSTTGNIKVASAATLATEADYIELVLVDAVWTEFNRVIA